MIVRPWRKGDTHRLMLQQGQQYLHGFVDVYQDLSELSDAGLAWVGEEGDIILVIAGLAPQWTGRALAWALVSQEAGTHFCKIHRAVKDFLDNTSYKRVEANVDVGFSAGHKWIKMLGFEPEGYMRCYRPDGADMVLYARIK